MSDLEEMGYLEQPHTSAGRIPSDKGYRLYVDRLLKAERLSISEANYIKDIYDNKTRHIEQIIFQTSKILSDITNYTAVVLGPKLSRVLVKHIQLVPIDNHFALLMVVTNTGIVRDAMITIPPGVGVEYLTRISNLLEVRDEMIQNREFFNSLVDALTESIDIGEVSEVYLGGTTNIFNYPEYHDIIKAKEFLDLMEQKELLYKLLAKSPDKGVSVTIGEENQCAELRDYSIITATYNINGKTMGTMGIIGPTRMEYSKTISVMDFMGKTLSNYLTRLFSS
jgi:heat-inducible transcriptional repressor